jgi:hypothetical protein
MTSWKSNFQFFIVYHKELDQNRIFPKYEPLYIKRFFTPYAVNPIYNKSIKFKSKRPEEQSNGIFEYTLDKFNPFLQKRGYMETSAYLHIYWNKLYEKYDWVGVTQYDMVHHQECRNLRQNTIYILQSNKDTIVTNGKFHPLMFPDKRDLNYLLSHYNKHFRTNYIVRDLEGLPLSLWQTGLYPKQIFEKLCSWLEKLVDDIYPWVTQPPYETHWGSIGGYTERAISLFIAIEIKEGKKYQQLQLKHESFDNNKLQYQRKTFLDLFEHNIDTIFDKNITGLQYSMETIKEINIKIIERIRNLSYYMFKAVLKLDTRTQMCDSSDFIATGNRELYCQRVGLTNQVSQSPFYRGLDDTISTGLIFSNNFDSQIRFEGFDMEAEDPRIFSLRGVPYIIMIALSKINGQKRGIAITRYDLFKPVFLSIENYPSNVIEKNWVPFVKNNRLYFVYNYSPLIILEYDPEMDTNDEGRCKIVYKEGHVKLPFETTNTVLRGGCNLLPLDKEERYYFGGCHSRIESRIYYHFSHFVILDTEEWKLEWISKPVNYHFEKLFNLKPHNKQLRNKIDIYSHGNILFDVCPNMIQDPISLNYLDGDDSYNKFVVTINVRDCLTFQYCLELGDWKKLIKDFNFKLENKENQNLHQRILDEGLKIIKLNFNSPF